MALQVSKIVQVAVPVQDVERAKSFYGAVLGLAHLFDAPPGLAFFRCGETRLMLARPEGRQTGGSSILYYGVNDVRAACRDLVEQGAVFEEEAKRIAQVGGKDIWLAILRDTEGNLLGLISEETPG